MALINCPDCDTQVSEKAVQCPKCAYPISSYFNNSNQTNKVENITVNVQQPTLNELVILSSKKSEGTAFLLIFFFGPFGLLYANPKKAAGVIVAMVLAVFLCVFMNDNKEQSYNAWLGVTGLIFWIVSVVLGVQGVNEYNSSLLETNVDRNINFKQTLDPIDKLRKLIKEEKNIPFYAPSLRLDILQLLDTICDTRENTQVLINEYIKRYNSDLIEDLKSLSNSYQKINENIAKFIELGFVDTEFPKTSV